jgi:hypothetical protein
VTTTKTTAFVLSGGASLGAIQAGMLKALYERRISPDLIVGASVGSVNGAFIASRPQTPATALKLAEVWRGLSRGEVFPLNPLIGLLELLRDRCELVVLPPPCPLRVSPKDFDHADELIGLGHSGATQHLAEVERGEAEGAPRMTMHDHRESTRTRVRNAPPATQTQHGPKYVPSPDA